MELISIGIYMTEPTLRAPPCQFSPRTTQSCFTMSVPSDQDPALVSYLQASLPIQLCAISAAALAVYDSFLTVDAEFAVFWSCRLRLSSMLYFINRYVEIMSCISAARLRFPVQSQ
ncbi:hypothetical protein C8T65DRAFT_646005, partial [Cerioporus squamosus]